MRRPGCEVKPAGGGGVRRYPGATKHASRAWAGLFCGPRQGDVKKLRPYQQQPAAGVAGHLQLDVEAPYRAAQKCRRASGQ